MLTEIFPSLFVTSPSTMPALAFAEQLATSSSSLCLPSIERPSAKASLTKRLWNGVTCGTCDCSRWSIPSAHVSPPWKLGSGI